MGVQTNDTENKSFCEMFGTLQGIVFEGMLCINTFIISL